MSPSSEKTLVGRIAAHERWAKTEDRTAATAPARAAFEARFPNENARKAYFARLALLSAQARRRGASKLTDSIGGEAA